jgi:nucleotide-binding universal stress UspA family protein
VAMGRYLVVANQTLGGEQLTAALDDLVLAGPCVLRFVVPVTDTEGSQQWDYPPIDRFIPDAHRIARSLAEGRLEHELARLRRAGVEASGEVMDAIPMGRIRELLDTEPFDGVIVSTLPRRLSRWLVMDLPHRIARSTQVPVTHVEGNAGPSL